MTETNNPEIEETTQSQEPVGIDAFLKQHVDTELPTQEVTFKRFKAPFKIRELRSDELDDLRKQATKTQVNFRTKAKTHNIDQQMLSDLMVAKSVISPDLNNPDLQASWNINGDAVKLLKEMLFISEYSKLTLAVNDMSNQDMDEDIDTAKK